MEKESDEKANKTKTEKEGVKEASGAKIKKNTLKK